VGKITSSAACLLISSGPYRPGENKRVWRAARSRKHPRAVALPQTAFSAARSAWRRDCRRSAEACAAAGALRRDGRPGTPGGQGALAGAGEPGEPQCKGAEKMATLGAWMRECSPEEKREDLLYCCSSDSQSRHLASAGAQGGAAVQASHQQSALGDSWG
jgi:hypothetical protein